MKKILYAVLLLSGTVAEKPKITKVQICPPNKQCYEILKVVAQ